MVTSIGFSLGAGAGIDTKALIEDLAKAQREPQEALILRRETANTAKVSALAEASSAIDGFASALSKLIAGGSLFTQPSVSDPTVLAASAIAGADISSLSAQVEVRQLAQSQSLVSLNLASPLTAVGQGTLTLTTASGSHAITINATNDSLDGLARAINDKNAGVSATVVTDSNGARLMLKGASGAANAFTLAVPVGTTSGLERSARRARPIRSSRRSAISSKPTTSFTSCSPTPRPRPRTAPRPDRCAVISASVRCSASSPG